jgi:hypothetical protein
MQNNIFLEGGPVVPALAYFSGIIVQCISIVRTRPPKWAFITFFGMLAYMGGMMAYAVISHARETNISNPSYIMQPMLSFGFVLGFLFIAIFLKQVIKVINEKVIFSVTLSYWFLLLIKGSEFSAGPLVLLVLLGAGPTAGAVTLIYYPGKIREKIKVVFYAWYLFVNAFFAITYFQSLPVTFMADGGMSLPFSESIPRLFALGMVVVHLLFNGGILYYTFIYSLMSRDIRQELVSYTSEVFSDEQISLNNITYILTVQVACFIAFLCFGPAAQFLSLSFWILLTPVIVIVLMAARRILSGAGSISA